MKSRLLLTMFFIIWISILSVYAQDVSPVLVPITAANADRVEQMNILGFGLLRDVAWSPNGKTIAVASSTGLILYDADRLDMALARRFAIFDSSMSLVAFSPDGKLLAAESAEDQPTISLWNIEKQQLVTQWTFDGSGAALVFSPDGNILAVPSGDQAHLWNVSALPVIYQLPDSRWLDVQRQWYLLRGADISAVEDKDIEAYSPTGTLLAVVGADATIDVWNVGVETRMLTTIPISARNLSFSPNGKLLFWVVSSGENTELHIWDIDHGEEAFSGTHVLNAYAFHPFESQMLFATGEGNLWLWDAGSRLQHIILGYEQQPGPQTVSSVAFSPTRPVVAVARMNHIELWNTASGVKMGVITANQDGREVIISMAISPDGSLIASAGLDGLARLWDARTLQQVAAIQHDSFVHDVTFSPDGRLLATYSDVHDNDSNLGRAAVFLWRISTIVPSSDTIAAKDAAVRIYHSNYVNNIHEVRFSPDGKTLALTGHGIELWNMAKVLDHGLNADSDPQLRDGLVSQFTDGAGPLAWSPDSTRLAVRVDDGSCSFIEWDIATQSELLCLTGHDGIVTDLTFNPQGDLIASGSIGSSDGAIQLWNAKTGELLVSLDQNFEDIWSVVLSSDGRMLASSSGSCNSCDSEAYGVEGTVRLWGIPTTR